MWVLGKSADLEKKISSVFAILHLRHQGSEPEMTNQERETGSQWRSSHNR